MSLPANAILIVCDDVEPPSVTVAPLPSITEKIDVFGGVVSIIHLKEAREASLATIMTPTFVTARTSKLCVPLGRELIGKGLLQPTKAPNVGGLHSKSTELPGIFVGKPLNSNVIEFELVEGRRSGGTGGADGRLELRPVGGAISDRGGTEGTDTISFPFPSSAETIHVSGSAMI